MMITSTGVSKLSFLTRVNDVNIADNSFNVYPNPVSDVLNIGFIEENDTDQNLEIYNTSMQLVKQVSIIAFEESVSLSVNDMASGMYFVKVGTQVSRIVVN
jgi:hypothetical protein